MKKSITLLLAAVVIGFLAAGFICRGSTIKTEVPRETVVQKADVVSNMEIDLSVDKAYFREGRFCHQEASVPVIKRDAEVRQNFTLGKNNRSWQLHRRYFHLKSYKFVTQHYCKRGGSTPMRA